MPDYELDEVYVIADKGAEQAFVANLNTLERASLQAKPQAGWEQEGHLELRQASIDLLSSKSYKTLLAEQVKVLPLWHGTGPAAAAGIAKSGFASLALVDCGYFGKGLYGSSSAEYSYRVYGKGTGVKDAPGYGEDGLLILSWYSAQHVYPVVKWDTYPGVSEQEDKLKGKANYQHYDSHFVRVKPEHPELHYVGGHSQRTEDVYFPIGENEADCYQEFVTFATAQVLPRYIISLKTKGSINSLPGMQKFLNSQIEKPITQGLYQDDLEQAIAKLKESARIEREEDFILSQGLSLYIPSLGADHDKIDNVKEEEQHALLDKSIKFLTHPKQELWLIQGNAGSGKSLFGRYLERELWDIYEDGNFIPLFIPLPRLGELSEDLITKALQLKGISINSILELKKTKKFLFILDGYDEIPGKPKLLQQYKFNEADNWQGKIIVGSRLQYLTSDEEKLLYPKHGNDTLSQTLALCTKSYIIPFKADQITDYIEHFSKSDFNSAKWTVNQYQNKLKEFQGISEFLKEPFLLFLVLSVLPDLTATTKLKKIDLYDAFTKGWFNSQFDRMVKYARKELNRYTKQSLLEIFNNYAKNLAFAMFLADTQVIRHNSQGEGSVFNKFFADEEAKLAFQGSPLKKIGESYLFMHKSFQEYFVASKVLDELALSIETGELLIPSLEQKLMVEAPAILNFISQRLPAGILREKNELEEKLFEVILNSCNPGGHLAIAAANAATILNTTRISFTGRDLRGVSLKGANLTAEILDNVNLEGADLREVRLKQAWLQNANLANSNMEGAIFGELAYKVHGEPVRSCSYSPDGKYFVSVGKRRIKFYEVGEVEIMKEIEEITTEDEIKSSSFSHDNKYFAAAVGNDILLYSRKENKEVSGTSEVSFITYFKTLTGHTNDVNSVAFSFDNQWLASGSFDNTVRLWSLTDLNENRTLTGHTGSVNSVAFSYDNQWLASSCLNDGVRLWSLKDPNENRTLNIGWAGSITFSYDNQWLACECSNAYTVHLWSLTDPNKHRPLKHPTCVGSITFSHDNQWLASAGLYDKIVRLWSLTDPNEIRTLTGHTGNVNSVAFSYDNQWLTSGSDDETVRLWSLTDLNETQTHTLTDGHTNDVNSVAFSYDNQWLASVSDDRTTRLWSLTDPNKNRTLIIENSHYVNSVAFSYDNQWLASGEAWGTVHLWSLTDPNENRTLSVDTGCACSITFSYDNQWLALGSGSSWGCCVSYDNIVHLWSLTDPNEKRILTGHTEQVNSVTFSYDNQWLASGSYDKTVRLWSLTDPNEKRILTGHTEQVNSVTFSYDNQWLASGSYDKTVRLWSLTDPNEHRTLTRHIEGVNSVTFSYDNQWLASGSDKEIIFWSREPLFNNHVWRERFKITTSFNLSYLTYAPSTDRLTLAAGGDFSVRIFEQLPNDKLALLWASTQTTLSSYQTNITGAHLSTIDAELLTQRGAIDYNNTTLVLFKTLNKINCDPEEITTLLTRADINAQEETNKNTLLIESIINKHPQVTAMLIAAKADPNISNCYGKTALHFATANGCIESTKLLIKSGATINQPDKNNETPLHMAKHPEITAMLIAAKADPNITNRDGKTALHLAITNGCIESTKLLIKSGATINQPDKNNTTPLHMAIAKDYVEIVALLIEQGAETDSLTNDKESAFSMSRKKQPILKLIVNQKLQNLSSKFFRQSLPTQQLFINLTKEHVSFEQLIDFIIENQGNLNETEQDQITLLMMATALQNYEATKKLIIAGADKDKTDGRATALHYVCAYGPPQVLTLLLEQDCSLDIPDADGGYLELWAVKKDNLETLKILLEFKRNGTQAIDINRIQGSTNKNLLVLATIVN